MSNKDIVRRYLDRVWNKRDYGAIEETIREDYIQHSKVVSAGRQGVRGFFQMIEVAFSNIAYSVEDMIEEGDKVAFRWTLRATHTGPFQGIAATNRAITLTGISLVRLQDGQLAENWVEQDTAGLIQQLRA